MNTSQNATFSRPHIVAYIAEFCRRPGMYLVGLPDHRTVNISYMQAILSGFRLAVVGTPAEKELTAFEGWVRRKKFRSRKYSSLWFGEALCLKLGGDHLRTVEQILEWAEEYMTEHGIPPAS
jgi:hypothetical protein